jgi:hypothetical protein
MTADRGEDAPGTDTAATLGTRDTAATLGTELAEGPLEVPAQRSPEQQAGAEEAAPGSPASPGRAGKAETSAPVREVTASLLPDVVSAAESGESVTGTAVAHPAPAQGRPEARPRPALAALGRVVAWPGRVVLSPRRLFRPRRRALLVVGCVALPVLALVGWVGVRGLLAYRELAGARSDLATLERRLLNGDVPPPAQLAAEVRRIDDRTRAARGLTGDPVWSAMGRLPAVGCPMRSAHTLAVAVDGVAGAGLPAMAQAAGTLNPATLRTGMSLDLPALARGKAPVDQAAVAIQGFRAALANVPGCGWTGHALRLTPARDQAATQARKLAAGVTGLKLAIQLAPSMLGGDGESRRYLLIVQNPAESRAGGGIIGGFGLLTARNGKLSLDDISGNNSLPNLKPNSPLLTNPRLPADLAARYGPFEPTGIWANANLTPDYPTAGRFYSGQYFGGTGVQVDGTISIDPTALSYLLAATRPAVMPDGRVISSGGLVKLVESDAYALIDDVNVRERFFADVGKAVYTAVTTGGDRTTGLLEALARSASEGRLQVSSNHADEEKVLAATALGGALPRDSGPFLAVVTQNAAASKLDYWARRSVDYRFQPRPDGSGIATITVRLLNGAPDGLPDYVRYRMDLGGPGGNPDPDGQNEVWLSVYTGVGSELLGASLDGRPAALQRDTEAGHPIASTYLALDRGKPRTLVLQVWEPPSGHLLTLRSQPLTNPERLTVEGLPVRRPWSLSEGIGH